MNVENQPKPDWQVLPRPGCENVEFRVWLNKEGLLISNLRFGDHATIDPHDAGFDIDVICVSGEGFIQIGDEEQRFQAGQTARWPVAVRHCLRTENKGMETIMVERQGK